MENVVRELMNLVEKGRLARVGYRRPGEAAATEFVVEPRRLHRTAAGLALQARQVSPAPETGGDGLRDFRVDRIASVAEAGQTFAADRGGAPTIAAEQLAAAPAAEGKLDVFHAWAERPIASMGPAEDYFRQLESAMLDGKVTPEEFALAESLRDRVESHERKAAHARVYANVLHEVLQDSRISHREELYLQNVRAFLDRLGWAP